MSKINVEGSEISIIAIDNRDYISLTDMVRNVENGVALIEKWLRNKNTIEFLGIWEEMYNANFNSTEFEGIKNEAGFDLNPKIRNTDEGVFVCQNTQKNLKSN